MTLTKTEQLVLRAMRATDAIQAEEIEDHIARGFFTRDELAHTDRCLQHVKTIVSSARIEAWGRKPSEYQVRQALDGLVRKGLVRKNTIVGMGGGFTDYMRTEA